MACGVGRIRTCPRSTSAPFAPGRAMSTSFSQHSSSTPSASCLLARVNAWVRVRVRVRVGVRVRVRARVRVRVAWVGLHG